MVLRSLIFLLVICAAPLRAQEVVVFAAASLKETVDAIAADFGDVTVSYGGSGLLARQVGQGAPVDVVLLANADWMDVLAAAGHVDPASVVTFMSNTLVIVGQPGAAPVALTKDDLLAALDGGRLAMGLTTSVPAGIYGRAALANLGLWEAVAPRVAEVDNVRAALALVARGEVPLGVVYQSDALVVPELAVVARIPAESHPPVAYLGAVGTTSANPRAAAFLAALQSPAAQETFANAGFCVDRRWC